MVKLILAFYPYNGEMIDYDNRTEYTPDISLLEPIAEALTHKNIELIIVNDEEMQEINHAFRRQNRTTDVLSFPVDSPFDHEPIGTIVISFPTAQKTAAALKHEERQELAVLFLHGVLHLLGLDHERDDGEMAAKEAELRARFNLPQTLIER